MSYETFTCGQYRLTIEYTPDEAPDRVIFVFARWPRANGSQGLDEVHETMSIPCFVEILANGIRARDQPENGGDEP